MDGGAIVGSGSYGCIFDPPLVCKNSRVKPIKGAVGKIAEPVDVQNELAIAKTILQIPDAAKYFVVAVPTSVCEPVSENQQPDRVSIQKCDFGTYKEKGLNGLLHFQMPYGGIKVSKRFGSNNGSQKPSKPTFPVISMITSLLECVAVLSLNGMVHFDLHKSNVLIDPASERFRLIDFGMTFSSKQITEEALKYKWRQYSPDFAPESPEITVIQGQREKVPFEQSAVDMVKQKPSILDAERLLGMNRTFQFREFKQFWTSSKAAQSQDWLAFLKFYWPAIDAWGVGNILLDAYKIWIRTPEVVNSKEWTTNSSRIKELLRGLLRMDPRKRFDAIEALSFFDPENSIVTSASGKAWLDQRAQIRAAVSAAARA